MAFFNNLKFWRRRGVTAEFQKLKEKQEASLKFWRSRGVTAEFQKLQGQQEATQFSQKLLEVYLCGRTTILEQQLEERDRERKELETTLRVQIKEEMEWDGTKPAAIKEREDKLQVGQKQHYERTEQEGDATRDQVEVAVDGTINRLHGTVRATTDPFATLPRLYTEFCNCIIETHLERERTEAALIGQIKELEKKIREKDCEMETMETKLRGLTKELDKQTQEANNSKKEVVSVIRGQIKQAIITWETQEHARKVEKAFRAHMSHCKNKLDTEKEVEAYIEDLETKC
jgi:phage tail tube protein FII